MHPNPPNFGSAPPISDSASGDLDWAELYHRNLDLPLPSPPTSPLSFSTAPSRAQDQTAATSAHGVEGSRVAKPGRRRSRASRRAPTTMLNTDAANFRAMVQQFTGIPSAPYPFPGGGFDGHVHPAAARQQQLTQYQMQQYQGQQRDGGLYTLGGSEGYNQGFSGNPNPNPDANPNPNPRDGYGW